LFISLFCSSLITNALPANANEARRYSPPITPAPQILDAPSPIKKKTNIVLKKYQLSELSNKYKLSSITIKNNLLVGTVEKGCDIYKLSGFYINYYKKIGNKYIEKVSEAAVLTMIIELNSTKEVGAIVNDDEGKLLLLAGRKVIFSEPLTLLGKKEINNINDRLKNNKIIIYEKTKRGETLDSLSNKLPYNFSSKKDRLRKLKRINGNSFYTTQRIRIPSPTFTSPTNFRIHTIERVIERQKIRKLEGISKYNLKEEDVASAVTRTIRYASLSSKDLSLEYNVKNKTEKKYICLDFSILENANCEGDKCLDEDVKNEVSRIITEGYGITVYPLFDQNLFRIPTSGDMAKVKEDFCSPRIHDTDPSKYKTELRSCSNGEKEKGYACAKEKVLLKYVHNGTGEKKTTLNFLLFHGSTFVDTINFNLTLNVKDNDINIIDEEYEKIANMSFPQDIERKHTLVVLNDDHLKKFALISKNTLNNKVELVGWTKSYDEIKRLLERGKDIIFNDYMSFKLYCKALDSAIISDNYRNDHLLKSETCNGRDRIEVIYPNQKEKGFSPITIEYLTTESNYSLNPEQSENERFVGDCYLVSHRSTVKTLPGEKIKSIHIYLHDSRKDEKDEDTEINKIRTEFEKLYKEEKYIFKDQCDDGEGENKKCFGWMLDKDDKPQEVYWHTTYPENWVNHENSLLIFNGHNKGGTLLFNAKKGAPFEETLGPIASQNYLLNVCGSPEQFPIHKITGRDYRNLMYFNKPILPEEAAISTFCSIDSFMQIPSGDCILMSAWMRGVRRCMKEKLGTNQLKELSLHIIGQMEEEVCRN
jgi:hypothetical protein